MDQLEHEEQALYDAYQTGEITRKQLNKQLDDLHRDWRAEAQEAADDAARQAYENEIERW